MTAIAFYHLQGWPLERVLPRLLEKTLKAGQRAVVVAGSDERVESLNTLLWTYGREAWLPHGSNRDGRAQDQPIWLSCDGENPNGAAFLFLTDGVASDRAGEFERCFDLFDGLDGQAVQAARERWKAYGKAGHALTYWRQDASGGWERKDQ